VEAVSPWLSNSQPKGRDNS